jgi:heterodisulfide reductase subunit C
MPIERAEIERLISECRLTSCLECGKCTASCPLSEVFGDVTYGRTPRGIIEKALTDSDLVTGDAIWYCITCDVCTSGCPSGVRLRDFVEALRELAMSAGHDAWGVRCKRCGRYFLPSSTQKHIIKELGGEIRVLDFLLQCPRCRPRHFSERIKGGPASK